MVAFVRIRVMATLVVGALLPLAACTPSAPPPTIPYDACGPQLITSLGPPGPATRVNLSSSGQQDAAGIPTVTTPAGDVVGVSGSDITADGGAVFFESRGALVAGGGANSLEVFRRDLASGTTTVVSLDAAGTRRSDDVSFDAISCDGRYVLLRSAAPLAGVPTGGVPQLFRRDLTTGEVRQLTDTKRRLATVAVDPLGTGRLSRDGNTVLWRREGAAAGTLGRVFLRDVTAGSDRALPGAEETTVRARVSRDGRTVLFTSIDTAFVDAVGTASPCLGAALVSWDLASGETTTLACTQLFSPINLSADGRFAEFTSSSWVNRLELATGERVQADFVARTSVGCVTTGGRYQYVIGQTYVPEFFGAVNTFIDWDVYRIDHANPASPPVLVAPSDGDVDAGNQMVRCSDDGRTVLFTSTLRGLVAGDTNGAPDLFVRSSPRT